MENLLMQMFLGKNTKQYLSGLVLILLAIFVLIIIIKYVPSNSTNEEVISIEETLNEKIIDNSKDTNTDSSINKFEPTFDNVIVDEDGQVVISGKASPNSLVKIYNGEELIGEVRANSNGDFVFIPADNFESGNYELKLFSNEIESKETVSVYIPEKILNNDSLVVLNDEAGQVKKVLQGTEESLKTKDLSFDSLSYSEDGMLQLSGKARPGSKIEAYIDGNLVGETITENDGFWNMVLNKPVNPGDYIIRFHQLENGSIISSIEAPIRQSDLSEVDIGNRTYVVQPGNSLWRISRRYYGKGILYTIIFANNNDQIENPHLIYPGQIFNIPEE